MSPWNDGARLPTGEGIYNLSTFATLANGVPSGCNPSNVDGYPDVAVGRLAVSDPNDLAHYVAKVVNYETQTMPYAGNATFVADYKYGGSIGLSNQIANGLPSAM